MLCVFVCVFFFFFFTKVGKMDLHDLALMVYRLFPRHKRKPKQHKTKKKK